MPKTPLNEPLFDIVIIGSGLAGLLTASLCAQRGLQCALVSDDTPPANRLEVNDGRTTAVMMYNTSVFKEIGIWETLADFSAPLKTIRIVTGRRKTRASHFNAQEQDIPAFAYNIPNDILKHALWQKVQSSKNITLFIDQKAIGITQEGSHATVRTSRGSSINTSLIIAADGRFSAIREQLGIQTKQYDYDQKALVFSVSHEKKHEFTSIERHKPNGPFTFVPLPDPHRSSIVWCDKTDRIKEILRLPTKLYLDEMQAASNNQLGALSDPSEPATFPLSSFYAMRLTGSRTALLGEAAHAVHPLGAQGFNLTIRDIATLDEEIMQFKKLGLDIGSPTLLSAYEARRHSDVQGRVRMLYHLTKFSSTSAHGLQSIWGSSIAMASHMPLLRRWVMRLGMAPESIDMPQLLKPAS